MHIAKTIYLNILRTLLKHLLVSPAYIFYFASFAPENDDILFNHRREGNKVVCFEEITYQFIGIPNARQKLQIRFHS